MEIAHKKQWEFLENKFESGQLAHAYLLAGGQGIGKKKFAEDFAGFIGCKFPDLMVVGEQNKKDPVFGDGGEIKISQIREVQNFLSYKSYHGGFKSVIINEAEKMNHEAQNCFLKTLEEPKGNTVLFLVTSRPDMMLPTIFSRCQVIKFFKPKGFLPSQEATEKEQRILEELLPVINAGLSKKFQYVKGLDFEEQSPGEILLVLQKYFRKKLLDNFEDQKAREILEKSEEISQKLLFTNANPKLALEVLLMEI